MARGIRDIDVEIHRSGLLLLKKKFRKVVEICTSVLETLGETGDRRKVAMILNNRGLACKKMKLFEQAMDDYSRAIEIDSSYAKAYYNRGLVLAQDLHRFHEALHDLDKAIELDPQYADSYNNKAMVLEKLGDKERALEFYRLALEVDPANMEAHNNVATMFFMDGRFEEAAREYETAIRIAPNDAELYFNLGLAYERMGKHALSRTHFAKAKTIDPLIDMKYQ